MKRTLEESRAVPKLAIVVPCYRVAAQILDLLGRIGPDVDAIYVVDDACPEKSGAVVGVQCKDSRVRVLTHSQNQGVGGAVVTGYEAAVADGADIVVKLDGDGQMDPALIPTLIKPITAGLADYTKGNRFYALDYLEGMPAMRLLGNAVLSFLTKASSGYWDILDPTNGFTAVHTALLRELPLQKLARRYFFESDLLFRLNVLRARVVDVPMRARYGDEQSSLRISKVVLPFLLGHSRNGVKRIFYSYFIKGFSMASVNLVVGSLLLVGGGIFGALRWAHSVAAGVPATAGVVMFAALPLVIGSQLLTTFFAHDLTSTPRDAVHPWLGRAR